MDTRRYKDVARFVSFGYSQIFQKLYPSVCTHSGGRYPVALHCVSCLFAVDINDRRVPRQFLAAGTPKFRIVLCYYTNQKEDKHNYTID